MTEMNQTRRNFIGTSTAGLLAMTAAGAAGSGERLSVGIVGPGGRGRGLLKNFLAVCKEQNAELTAVCDIWSRNRDVAADLIKLGSGKEPRKLSRLEDLLALRDLDAVIVATPDHQHARQLATCLAAKKHVYLEKPFANRLDDAVLGIDAARKSDRVITIGTQRRSHALYMGAADLMRTGIVGPVTEVAVIQNAYSPYRWRNASRVKELREKDTDWKAFLMDRPMRAFDPHQHVEFRLYRDFSTGIIDQWMTHLVDTVHMLTGATHPRSVVAHGGCFAWKDGRENGDAVHVVLEYPQGFLATYSCNLANGSGRACRIMGRNGTLEFESDWKVSGDGVTGSKVQSKPIAPRAGVGSNMDHVHMANWLACVRKGDRNTHCTAEHGFQHAIACILSDRALHSGRRQQYDEKARTIRES